MKLAERILLYLSRNPESGDYGTRLPWDAGSGDEALELLNNEFSNLSDMLKNKKIVDFGCGKGKQSAYLAGKMDCFVLGLDINTRLLEFAISHAQSMNIPKDKLLFLDKAPDEMLGTFDYVISQNSFEHFSDPREILDVIKRLLNDTGKLILTFGPVWYSPDGPHMSYFCKLPWAHILFSEKTVMNVRARFRNDGATKYEDVEDGLNKMSVAKFEQLMSASGMKIEFKKYHCIKGLNFLRWIPIFRELFINHISVLLSKDI